MSVVAEHDVGIWSRRYRRFTVGLYATILLAAFETLAVTTVAPVIAADLNALEHYTWIMMAAMAPQIVGSVFFAGIVDRRGVTGPFVVGVLLLGAGLLAAALAQNMLWMIGARTVQGLGMGAVVNTVYASISLVFPDRLRPRAFALVAGAYVLPALAGPPLIGALTAAFSWRAVFVAALPMLAAAPVLVLPAVRTIAPADESAISEEPAKPGRGRTVYAAVLAVGVLVVAAGFTQRRLDVGAVMVLGGLAATFASARRVLPDGVFTARPVRPAALATRGLVTAGFLGTESVVAYSLTVQHHIQVALVGVAIGCAALAWVLAAWLQSRWDAADDGAKRGRRMLTGVLCLLGGAAVVLTVPLLSAPFAAFAVAAVGHSIGGFGIGMAESTSGAVAMAATPSGESGMTASGMQLADLVTPTVGLAITGYLLASLGTMRSAGAAAVLAQVAFVLLAAACAARIRHTGTQPEVSM